MENELIMFKNEEFGELKVLKLNNEEWFIAKEVSEKLGYTTLQRMYDHVDKDDKIKINPQDKQYQGLCENGINLVDNDYTFNLILINESGLYASIFGSQLDSAKRFKRWVTKEVLPSIRKTGGYIPITEEDSDLMIMSKAMQIMQNTLSKKDELIQLQQPKVQAYESLMDSRGDLDFNEFVKSANLKVGRNKLFHILREEVIIRPKPSTEPYERYRKQGYFKVIQVTNGFHSTSKTLITKKGMDWLMKKCFEWDLVNEIIN